jgi:hypothetical protein
MLDEIPEANIYADRFGGLRLPGRRLAYVAARRAWLVAKQQPEDAQIEFRGDFRIRGFDPAMIELLLRLAILLFECWLKNKIDEPSSVPTGMEPINWEDDNDAD